MTAQITLDDTFTMTIATSGHHVTVTPDLTPDNFPL
jgi:hypothetical protein